MLLGMGIMMTYGFYRVGQGIREQKYVNRTIARFTIEMGRDTMWGRGDG